MSNGGGTAGRGDGWPDVRNTLETEGLLKNSPRLPIPGSAFLCQVNPERKGLVEGLLANTLALPDVLPEEVIFKPFFKMTVVAQACNPSTWNIEVRGS